jgi:hypothetical protein
MTSCLERNRVFGALALALMLGLPAFAADVSRDDPGRAALRIETARVALDTAVQAGAAATAPVHPDRDKCLQRATLELQLAARDYEQGLYRGAQHHAEKAERLVWKASAPQREK